MSNLNVSRAERLDQRVVALMPLVSRSFATKLINDGKVAVNGVVTTKGGAKLKPEDEVVIDYQEEEFVIPQIELPVIYEDDDCVVVNKPIGLLTHSKGAFNPEASVATWLHNRIDDKTLIEADEYQPNRRAGIVHRLDRATSGVLIAAKTTNALSALQKQFSQRKAKKTYMAVVAGHLKQPEAVIDMPIERNPKAPATFRVGANGKPALTRYKVLDESQHYSLVELSPETGRTHQLRVHLAQLGHPIVGDTLYNGKPAERMYLHAARLELTTPDRERRTFEATVPSTFQVLLNDDK
ncbi:MAG TPA: RluA family pseudouridine synthase [Candidatus Saccharimonadales bacterium]